MRITNRLKAALRWRGWFWQWGLLFLALVVALWSVTQFRDAPLFILLTALTVITLNFSLPPGWGGGGLVPIVTVSSLLLQPLATAVILFLAGFGLAQLTHPFWEPVGESAAAVRPSWQQRWGQGIVYLLALLIAGYIYRRLGGSAPIIGPIADHLRPVVGLAIAYGAGFFILSLLFWLLQRRPLRQFLVDVALSNLAFGFLSLPVAVLGVVVYLGGGLPTFVIFALGITLFSVVTHLAWRRRLALSERLDQFAALNRAGLTLRETLDLPTVLELARQEILALVAADRLDILLLEPQDEEPQIGPDDFTNWVARKGRVLDLDGGNMHFAQRHGLTPPDPAPAAWLGIPLVAADAVIGVMTLQRSAPGRPFSQWHRELLMAMAGQASAAIQNARLYGETLRLFNLTDEALARRVEQLQALLDGMQEGVLLVDRSGRAALVNPLAAALLDQAASDWRSQPLSPTVAGRLGYSLAAWEDRLAALAAGQEPEGTPHTFSVAFENRGPRSLSRQETAVHAQDGRVMGWLILLRDVTEEQELAEQRADLIRMIVHDLRNPLTTLLSTLNMIERSDEAELLTHARQGVDDMLDMVDSLMDLNRMEAGQAVVDAEAMRLPPLVNNVVARLRPLATSKSITLQFDCEADLPAVWGDADMLRRVLVNLLDNALNSRRPAGR